jgi:hypothetical protein
MKHQLDFTPNELAQMDDLDNELRLLTQRDGSGAKLTDRAPARPRRPSHSLGQGWSGLGNTAGGSRDIAACPASQHLWLAGPPGVAKGTRPSVSVFRPPRTFATTPT